MKLLVGLGNPGEKYKSTRHNVGFLVLDRFEESKDLKLLKPDTFMNNSGESVKKAVDFFKVNADELWVIHDDLDIKLGEYKIQKGVGPKDHKGLISVEERLGKKDFWRVRVGVDNRDPENRIGGEDYVLQNFSSEEKEIVDGVVEKVVEDLVSRFK